jgi:hypothetical protein
VKVWISSFQQRRGAWGASESARLIAFGATGSVRGGYSGKSITLRPILRFVYPGKLRLARSPVPSGRSRPRFEWRSRAYVGGITGG